MVFMEKFENINKKVSMTILITDNADLKTKSTSRNRDIS